MVINNQFVNNIYNKQENYSFKIINIPNHKDNIPYHDSYSSFPKKLVSYAIR